VRRAVYPDRKTAGYDKPASGETFSEFMSRILALRRGVAAADDG